VNSFRPDYLNHFLFHPSTTWFLSQCAEARGKQDLWQKTRPEILKTLQDSAIVQSTESSNRIEGVEVRKDRLLPLVLGNLKPFDRNEEEIVGYRKALSFIHQNYHDLKITSETIKKLHLLAQDGQIGDAGVFKKSDNEIIEILPNGERTIRFKATLASETEHAVSQMCLGYNDLINQKKFPDLFLISTFVFDFLCIHPFRDGNGRVSRLLTLLLLYQNNYLVGRYISLERLVEISKQDYYRVLKQSSDQWHEKKHDLFSWTNYFISILREAYKELEIRVENVQVPDSKTSLVRQIIEEFPGKFRLRDVSALLPEVSDELIKKVLNDFKKEEKYFLEGRGPGAYWKKKTN
jgi:Fic family protein